MILARAGERRGLQERLPAVRQSKYAMCHGEESGFPIDFCALFPYNLNEPGYHINTDC